MRFDCHMKRLELLLLGAFIWNAVLAQSLVQGEPALVYYSPMTLVNVEFTYSVETLEPGEFAAYAEPLLGIEDAIKTKQTTYQLKKATISSFTQTDYTRPHKVVADGTFPMLLSINEKGLLMGYNLPPYEKKSIKSQTFNERNNNHPRKPMMPPFTEEVTSATTPQAKADAVAKQILHLREMRTYLLNGEVEHAPADGEAMKQVLDDLSRQEEALMALFTGKKSHFTRTKTVQIKPVFQAEGEEDTLTTHYFFSEENGFTDADNIDADTICVQLSMHKQLLAQPVEEPKKNKKSNAPELSPLVYNLPGNAAIQVTYKNRNLAKRTLPIAQLGVDVPLAKDLFKGDKLPVIVISEKTGSILSISK